MIVDTFDSQVRFHTWDFHKRIENYNGFNGFEFVYIKVMENFKKSFLKI